VAARFNLPVSVKITKQPKWVFVCLKDDDLIFKYSVENMVWLYSLLNDEIRLLFFLNEDTKDEAILRGKVFKKEKLVAKQSKEEKEATQKIQTLDEVIKDALINALEISYWQQQAAAKLLGLTARQMNYRVQQYGINNENWRRKND